MATSLRLPSYVSTQSRSPAHDILSTYSQLMRPQPMATRRLPQELDRGRQLCGLAAGGPVVIASGLLKGRRNRSGATSPTRFGLAEEGWASGL